MTRDDDDARIAQILDEAHQGDAPPPFAHLARAEHPGRRTVRPWAWALVAGAAALAVVLLVSRGNRSHEAAPDTATHELDLSKAPWVGWHAPTDFLLETPGHSVLESMPTLGTGSLALGALENETNP